MLRHEACALYLLAGHSSIPHVHAWGRSQYFEYLAIDILGTPLTDKRLDVNNALLLIDQMVRELP
jgi:casein kinase I family protein HRR25